jgi:diguanylate cyclase (GGDEF)-like protein
MFPFQPPKVLVLAADADAGRRWAEALADSTAGVWRSAEDLPPGGRPDVIVTDLAADEVERRTGLKLDPKQASEVGQADVVVVGIGSAAWADVALAVDCTGRELRLACRLVAEIGRLRSQRDELNRIRHEATQLAQTDPLTGLPNRRAWEHQLNARLPQGHGRLWLGIVDLDGFKQVNDRLGMAKGDEVLARAAQSLAGQLRREDMAARLGGDEFGVMLWDVGEQHVESVFDRLRAAVAEQAATEGTPHVTASIGYVAAGDESPDGEALFAAAERAMRQAKRAGGNRAVRG